MSLIKSLRYNPFTNQINPKVLTEYYVIEYLEEINAYGVKLNEAPLYGTSVTVSRVSDGFLFSEVSHSTNPQQGEFRVDYYNINNDTLNLGTGYIEFNSADAGTEVLITYTGVGEYGDALNPYYNYYSNLFNHSETNNQLIIVSTYVVYYNIPWPVPFPYHTGNVRIPPKIVNFGDITLKHKGVYLIEIKIYDLKIEAEKAQIGGAITKTLYGSFENGIAYYKYNPSQQNKVDTYYYKYIKINFLSLNEIIEIPLIYAQSYAYAEESVLRKPIMIMNNAGITIPLNVEFMQTGVFNTENGENYPFFIAAHLGSYDITFQQPLYGAITLNFKMQIRVDKIL